MRDEGALSKVHWCACAEHQWPELEEEEGKRKKKEK